MKIKILEPKTILLEGHIRMAFQVGKVIDIGQADAEAAISQGIAEAFIEAPVMAPQEKAVAAPKERKAKEEAE